MRYSFSAEFLKVLPPDRTFGNAWESLCFRLLAAVHGPSEVQRLCAPDGGIDLFLRTINTAFQCKSDERGALGSLSAPESIKSLKAAVAMRSAISWDCYTYATNANFTGSAVKSILTEATALSLRHNRIKFMGPECWDALCEEHFDIVRDLFDFRVTVTEAQVVEAFRKAHYYDKYVSEYAGRISKGNFVLNVKNNWTPLELEIPFAPELTVENCVDAVQELLGVSLKWTNFADLGTSVGPSVSLTVDRQGQRFKQTLGEVQAARGTKDLVFWITLGWKDEPTAEEADHDQVCERLHLSHSLPERSALSEIQRYQRTIMRAEEMIQEMIWASARRLKNPREGDGAF